MMSGYQRSELRELRLFAVTATCHGRMVFSDEPHTTVERHLVKAESPEAAVQSLSRKSSIYSLGFGKTFEVREVGDVVQVWHAQYDGAPMDEMRPTTAKLVIARRVDLEQVPA